MSSFEAELAKKEIVLASLKNDMSDLNAKRLEQLKQMEEDMCSKDATAQCKLIACFGIAVGYC